MYLSRPAGIINAATTTTTTNTDTTTDTNTNTTTTTTTNTFSTITTTITILLLLLIIIIKLLRKHLLIKSRRRFYGNFDDIWYEYQALKDVIVPYTAAVKLASIIHNTSSTSSTITINRNDNYLQQYISQKRVKSSSSSSSSKLKTINGIVVFLGHFNHGKTTLLDAMSGTDIVADEAHGITQVVRTRMVPLATGIANIILST